jgi:hypothetical protein
MAISLYRTMSLVRSQAAAGENFFMMVFQFLETFVGSLSSGCITAQNILNYFKGTFGIVVAF